MEDSNGPVNISNTDTPKPPQLLEIELRVLGVLMEKQLTTPDLYPLTLNSIITACNQKSSRDPVTNYHQGEVLRALNELEEKRFVRKEHGSRADKYSQHFIASLELGKKQQALLCIMILRGPQTLSELNTRTQRMDQFSDKEELNHCIDRLCEREIPYAIHLGEPGHRGERIAHLFSGTPRFTASAPRESASASPAAPSAEDSAALSVLELDVASLRDTVRQLELENLRLKHQMETLYQLTDNELPQESADNGGGVH
ncbi:MAG: YceH family protein [Granulosicoccaceae bacterium]